MPNMANEKVKMREQDPNVRNKNFDEVTCGYSAEEAMAEAARCLNCKHKPCMDGCPVSVQIPRFISCIAAGEFKKALEIIGETNSLPAVCGRVCPQESQCEQLCVRGKKGEPVAVGRLERFAADNGMDTGEAENAAAGKAASEDVPGGIKVAVIGAGPAGLTCAGDLVKLGYDVTIFEAFHIAGGVLVYGIPEFRLPKAIVRREIDKLAAAGVKLRTNYIVGRTVTVEDLFEEGYKAVFIGSGAGLPKFMNIPGENLNGVFSANEFLTRINLMKAYRDEYDTPVYDVKKVAVVGGGNVAMDAARCAKRIGAEEVYIIYRRSLEEMPARQEEVHHAMEEGIIFKLLTNPVEIKGEDGRVSAITCDRMELGEPDAGGRRRPVVVEGGRFDIGLDCVIMALGTSPNPLISATTGGLEVNKWGCLEVDGNLMTTRAGVFAGGDAVTGAATVILAMGAGKRAADGIDSYIKKGL
ncbi:MAG: NADPH-dependent glutamate synthase [Oscillospiraceae bacterium]|nr:NADPH-dependent glutamate synthase [Oscillospiraceae bacterium]